VLWARLWLLRLVVALGRTLLAVAHLLAACFVANSALIVIECIRCHVGGRDHLVLGTIWNVRVFQQVVDASGGLIIEVEQVAWPSAG